MSGIDKVFDYVVPGAMEERVSLGCRVRVDLHGRRVSGWVVALGEFDPSVHPREPARLSPLVSLSGAGVLPEIVELTKWVASHWWGPWRAVLTSASSPRARLQSARAAKGNSPRSADDDVSTDAGLLRAAGGGLLVVPPLQSALNAVTRWASDGSVLVVCPTVSMAVAGAASLRRRGFTTALVPDDWERAAAGVDVVIGARSSVFAPCAHLSGVIVIDEHDELLHEERVPTWDATSVAIERARLAEVPFMATSAVPSLRSQLLFQHRRRTVRSARSWPSIVVVDLDEVPVRGSLLSSELLSSVRNESLVTVCVLNTKGGARVVVCKSCRKTQTCGRCGVLLTQDDAGELSCPACQWTNAGVCVACGRTAFVVPRAGVSRLREELQASTGVDSVELTGDSDDDWSSGRVFIGTEAVLHRVRSADCVVFADIDRDLGASRMSAPQEVLSLVARAARTVGPQGTVVVQTRQPNHRLMKALASKDIVASLESFSGDEMSARRDLGLPPFCHVARVTIGDGRDIAEVGSLAETQVARDPKGHLLRAGSWHALDVAVSTLRSHFGTAIRVNADPLRY